MRSGLSKMVLCQTTRDSQAPTVNNVACLNGKLAEASQGSSVPQRIGVGCRHAKRRGSQVPSPKPRRFKAPLDLSICTPWFGCLVAIWLTIGALYLKLARCETDHAKEPVSIRVPDLLIEFQSSKR